MRRWWGRFKLMRRERYVRELTRRTIRDMDTLKETLR